MRKAKLQIHLFKVSNTAESGRSLEAMINSVANDDLEERIRSVGSGEVRLDAIDKKKKNGVRKWYLDFTRIRDTHGPGKARRDTPVEGLDIGEDEFYGEEAAALYLPDKNYLLVQYNHYGVRPGSMQSYFSDYIDGEINVYSFSIALDKGAEARFKRGKYLTRFEIKVNVDDLTKAEREAGGALADAAAAAARLNARTMTITMSAGREKKRNLLGAKETFWKFFHGSAAIQAAIVSSREKAEGQTEVIDLINEKLVHNVEVTPDMHRRLAAKDRYRALSQAYDKWSSRIDAG